MGLYNQGWMIRCDWCGENLVDCIGGYAQFEIVTLARELGWRKLRNNKWQCPSCSESEGR